MMFFMRLPLITAEFTCGYDLILIHLRFYAHFEPVFEILAAIVPTERIKWYKRN